MRNTILAACLLMAMGGRGVLCSAESEHHHGHGEQLLTLDHGKKWAVDGPLRQGMAAIHATTASHLHAFHQGQLAEEGYQALRQEIETQVENMVRQCRLPATADATLHVFLTNLQDHGARLTTATLEERKKSMQAIVETLNHYGHYFDHPDWRELR